MREKISGKVTEWILEICYGSEVMQQNVGWELIYPPFGSMCANLPLLGVGVSKA